MTAVDSVGHNRIKDLRDYYENIVVPKIEKICPDLKRTSKKEIKELVKDVEVKPKIITKAEREASNRLKRLDYNNQKFHRFTELHLKKNENNLYPEYIYLAIKDLKGLLYTTEEIKILLKSKGVEVSEEYLNFKVANKPKVVSVYLSDPDFETFNSKTGVDKQSYYSLACKVRLLRNRCKEFFSDHPLLTR